MFKYSYNTNLAEDFKLISTDPDKFRKKLESNQALKSSLLLLQKQLTYVKSYNNSTATTNDLLDIPLYAYKDLLMSLALATTQANVQVLNRENTYLTNYGKWLNEIRKTVYQEQSTAKGFIGTLSYYSDFNNPTITTDLDFLDKLLYDYWEHIDPNLTNLKPRQRFIQTLINAQQTIDPDFYLDLSESILSAIATKPDAKRKLNSLLLTTEEFKYLQPRMYLLDFSADAIAFLVYLCSQQYINYNFWAYKNFLIQYKPVGGLNLVLIALVVEALTLIIRTINAVPIQVQQSSVSTFINNSTYYSYSQEIATYYALAYDACTVLAQVYPDFRALAGTFYIELQKFIKVNIDSIGDYRLSPASGVLPPPNLCNNDN